MEVKNIGWIGTGVMGRSMAMHLIDAPVSGGDIVYIAAQAMGFETLGTQGLYKVLKRMNDAV